MARPKAVKQHASTPASPTPEATTADGRDAISLKTTTAFRQWLTRLAEHERDTVVQVLEKAAVHYAKARGFTEEAPKRTRR